MSRTLASSHVGDFVQCDGAVASAPAGTRDGYPLVLRASRQSMIIISSITSPGSRSNPGGSNEAQRATLVP